MTTWRHWWPLLQFYGELGVRLRVAVSPEEIVAAWSSQPTILLRVGGQNDPIAT
jgi:hypothetical protein